MGLFALVDSRFPRQLPTDGPPARVPARARHASHRHHSEEATVGIPRPQLRHVLALLLMLVATPLVWQTARALSAGATPDKANNPRKVGGVVQPAETCNKSGCHTTLPANGCTGKVEILGLPGCYVAGQTYNLQVKVTDAFARRWGFEVGVQYNEGNFWDY